MLLKLAALLVSMVVAYSTDNKLCNRCLDDPGYIHCMNDLFDYWGECCPLSQAMSCKARYKYCSDDAIYPPRMLCPQQNCPVAIRQEEDNNTEWLAINEARHSWPNESPLSLDCKLEINQTDAKVGSRLVIEIMELNNL